MWFIYEVVTFMGRTKNSLSLLLRMFPCITQRNPEGRLDRTQKKLLRIRNVYMEPYLEVIRKD